MRIGPFFLIGLFLIVLAACDPNRVYEKNQDFEGNNWYVDSVATFPFEIADASQKYNVLINVRNSISYPFTNLYIKYNLKDSSNKILSSKQIRFALFDKKTGKPLGEGLGDIFDQQFLVLKDYSFATPGKYKMEIVQYMRQDPLPFIMAVGTRIEEGSSK